ncbi:MAG: sigma-70 family RNA polymerase sigma factor [Bacteroidetes bacterium]|nr:sigma-70 family RNA polymerase sigma factor [Bacteroidota bacterium]MBL6962827.1 sigma-70 family RNA polymerase sigma factor [Bacteroidota bacterium]
MRKAIISDEKLIQNYLNGNEDCLRMLINRYQNKLYSYIVFLIKDRTLAEDVFQDTFVKVINTLKNGKYKEEGKFYQWVVRIARNLVIDHFRKTSKMPVITDSNGNDLMSSLRIVQENREDEIIQDETIVVLKRLIQSLPKEQKEVLVLRHYADLSFKEISNLTNVSINTSLGRMRYALLNLRKMLVKHNISI